MILPLRVRGTVGTTTGRIDDVINAAGHRLGTMELTQS
jgi:acyl-coenzyme A synthetase/AMP-(fatty) acid ligase